MIVLLRKIFHPRKQKNRIILVGKASDLTFKCQCVNNELPCPRRVKPGRKKKALERCWGCSYLEFSAPENKCALKMIN